MFVVRVIWGETLHAAGEYTFETRKEMEAFLLGADEGVGWMEYGIVQGDDVGKVATYDYTEKQYLHVLEHGELPEEVEEDD